MKYLITWNYGFGEMQDVVEAESHGKPIKLPMIFGAKVPSLKRFTGRKFSPKNSQNYTTSRISYESQDSLCMGDGVIMPCHITDGPQYDDDLEDIPTDPQAVRDAELNDTLRDIARGMAEDQLREMLRELK